ncbi:uncharacterized protein LOC112489242 [Ziziphus jujuba]|uniref:Uncharacterized protein LOC112489242 n=1 Tax=Ziziphus jujuba TaxID=326968 RepID=A0A6P6FNA1_ZIZJJ|nr:uncharacterized protein LOC112489242 [Ziziphus jujuba]
MSSSSSSASASASSSSSDTISSPSNPFPKLSDPIPSLLRRNRNDLMHWLPKHGKHHQPELLILPNLLQDQRLPYFPNSLHIPESHTIFRVPPFVHDPNDACNAACLGTCGEAGVVEEKEVAEFHGLELVCLDGLFSNSF